MIRTLRIASAILIFLPLCASLHGVDSATLGYEQTFSGSDPEHYVISVASDCLASYQSNGKLSEQGTADESFQYKFKVSESNCGKIFSLTQRAHYFQGQVDSRKKHLSSTGVKILSYKDNQKDVKATYNYSPLPEVQELTSFFQQMSTTLEFGRRLEYDHQYQKLALYDDLKRMDKWTGKDGPEEVSAIAETLQRIVDDTSLMNVVRTRARELLTPKGK